MKKSLSFAAGMLLGLLAVFWSIAVPALQSAHFEQAVLNNVDREAVGMSESALTAFARETMDYLNGRTDEWSPETPFVITNAFVKHMAEVRLWVDVLKAALPVGVALAAAGILLGRDRRMVRLGMLCMLGVIAAVLLWAAADFESLWMVIHVLFIPNGIFAAGEPVMMLFPLSLFFGYVVPVVWRLAVSLAVMLGLCSVKWKE